MTDPPVCDLAPVAPETAGFDPEKLAGAGALARAHEPTMDRDIGRALAMHLSEPLPEGQIAGRARVGTLPVPGTSLGATAGPVRERAPSQPVRDAACRRAGRGRIALSTS